MQLSYIVKHIEGFFDSKIKNELLKRIISGSFWNLSGALLSRGFISLAWIIVARFVGSEIYGEFGIIRSSLGVFQVLAVSGMGITATKYIAELKNIDKERINRIITFTTLFAVLSGAIISIFFCIFSRTIALSYLNSESLTNPLRLSSLLLFLFSVNSIQLGILNGFEEFKTVTKINFIQGVMALPFYSVLAYFFKLNGIVLAYVLNMLIYVLASHYEIHKLFNAKNIKYVFDNLLKEHKIFTTIGLPATLTALMVTPSVWISNIMIVNTKDGYAQLGIFNGILIFSTLLQLLGANFNNVLLPIYLNVSNNKIIDFINYYGFWFFTIYLSLPIIYIYEIPTVLIGSDFINPTTRSLLGIIFIYTFIIAHRQGISRELISKRKMWLSFFSMGIFSITLIVFVSLLKEKGAYGIALANLFGYLINMLIFGAVFAMNKLCSWKLFYGLKETSIWISFMLLGIPQMYELSLLMRCFILLGHLLFISLMARKIYVDNVA